MRIWFVAAPAAWPVTCLLLLAACSQDAAPALREWKASDHPPPPAVPREGQGEGEGEASPERAAMALWGMRCASCHGERGRGDGAGRPPGAAIPDLTSPEFQASRDDRKLAEAIFKGQGLMPAFGDQLTEQGIVALIGHIRRLKASR